jgi:hypothetical protein
MTKIRDLIEKIWWVIPPIILVFGVPLYYTFNEMITCFIPMSLSSFIWYYSKNFPIVMGSFFSFRIYGIIAAIIFLSFIGCGYYAVRKHPSLLWRIIIVSGLAFIGFHAGFFSLMFIIG